VTDGTARPPPPARGPSAKALLLQGLAVLAVVAACVAAGHNAAGNLARRNIDVDFGFLLNPAGFDIPFRLTAWSTADSYGYALLVSGLNTLLASVLAIALATALGLVLALMRLSINPLASWTARALVELVRNTPQLLQIVFWYIAVLQVLPNPRASVSIADAMFLNVRGLFMPAPLSPSFGWLLAAGVAVAVVLPRALPRLPLLLTSLGPFAIAIGVAMAVTDWEWPALRGFNFAGGWRLPPELLALAAGIGIYTAAFISENIRASIGAVGHGQREAARSLGLSAGRTMRLIVLPQALRTLIPPMTSHYLNIIKSTTLGAAIAYPEILQIFARTVLNQSGRAIEVMSLVLGVFLALNLTVSALMSRWDRRLALQSR
jgi:general L-amino acid transport system permease protein